MPKDDEERRDYRLLSQQLEALTGADSIETIERMYWEKEDQRHHCVYPRCVHRTATARAMWIHVHFKAHGPNFPFDLEDLDVAPDYAPFLAAAYHAVRSK